MERSYSPKDKEEEKVGKVGRGGGGVDEEVDEKETLNGRSVKTKPNPPH